MVQCVRKCVCARHAVHDATTTYAAAAPGRPASGSYRRGAAPDRTRAIGTGRVRVSCPPPPPPVRARFSPGPPVLISQSTSFPTRFSPVSPGKTGCTMSAMYIILYHFECSWWILIRISKTISDGHCTHGSCGWVAISSGIKNVLSLLVYFEKDSKIALLSSKMCLEKFTRKKQTK